MRVCCRRREVRVTQPLLPYARALMARGHEVEPRGAGRTPVTATSRRGFPLHRPQVSEPNRERFEGLALNDHVTAPNVDDAIAWAVEAQDFECLE
jgi:hypothetical protein